MSVQALSLPSLQEVVSRILTSRQITRFDQQLLLSVCNFSGEEQRLINQVFDHLRTGLLKVVD
ncbi:MAG TPA: hypothetical protein V6D18_05745 [Thermosynechococcaceae cyanobacterium]